ncbi:translation initiation factor IF-2 [Striga asiatica]|uniref:Translation initiation factor IF-2 n=1 Tax=Striga asiatica TaxID=4170 RepID=A0A5A7Q2L3_STRAF|nr:translation initiation factor IF-2 [Striga asiatica]
MQLDEDPYSLIQMDSPYLSSSKKLGQLLASSPPLERMNASPPFTFLLVRSRRFGEISFKLLSLRKSHFARLTACTERRVCGRPFLSGTELRQHQTFKPLSLIEKSQSNKSSLLRAREPGPLVSQEAARRELEKRKKKKSGRALLCFAYQPSRYDYKALSSFH